MSLPHGSARREAGPQPVRAALAARLELLAEQLADAGDFEGLERLALYLDRVDDRGNALTWPAGWVDTVSATLAEALV